MQIASKIVVFGFAAGAAFASLTLQAKADYDGSVIQVSGTPCQTNNLITHWGRVRSGYNMSNPAGIEQKAERETIPTANCGCNCKGPKGAGPLEDTYTTKDTFGGDFTLGGNAFEVLTVQFKADMEHDRTLAHKFTVPGNDNIKCGETFYLFKKTFKTTNTEWVQESRGSCVGPRDSTGVWKVSQPPTEVVNHNRTWVHFSRSGSSQGPVPCGTKPDP